MKNNALKSGIPQNPGILLFFIIVFLIAGCNTNSPSKTSIKNPGVNTIELRNRGVSDENESLNIFFKKQSPPQALYGDLRFQSLD